MERSRVCRYGPVLEWGRYERLRRGVYRVRVLVTCRGLVTFRERFGLEDGWFPSGGTLCRSCGKWLEWRERIEGLSILWSCTLSSSAKGEPVES